jgi:23S rRNA pseudouridine2605 synthase
MQAGGKPERLQKILAHAGLGSRRDCEEYISQGRVTVDGQVVRELGTKVDPEKATIAVDGERIHLEKMVYYAVNKPKGYVSTNDDPAGRPRVIDLLPEVPERVYSVGRLDEDSTGLMLLTNDGELANRLAHPRYGVEKTYRALVAGAPSRETLAKLTEGIWLSDGKVRAQQVRVVGTQGEATTLELVLAEGKKREIRRMLAKLGHKVMTLTRIALGPIVLKGLSPGEHRPLSATEIDLLRKAAAGIRVSPPGVRKGRLVHNARDQ